MIEEIATKDLSEDDLPPQNAKWEAINEFALTFNGYEYWGSFDKCADVANQSYKIYVTKGRLPDSVNALRSCLFFEQRRWRHFGECPDEETMAYIHQIIESIRTKIQIKQYD